jgi:serine/threonine protein kinase
VVTEFYGGGELLDFLKKRGSMSEYVAARWIRDAISAISTCHKNEIIH